MRTLTIFLVAFLMLAVPIASAQTLTVAISQSPAEFPPLATNSTGTATVEISVRLSGVACPAATAIPVQLTVAAGAPVSFFTAAADAESYSISVPAGAYPGDPAGAGVPGPVFFNGKTTAGIIGTTTVITDNASIPVQITATATPPGDCQPSGGAPVMSDTVTIFSNLTAPPPPPAPTPEPEETPGLGALGALVALVGAVLIRRARRQG